jgi:acyl-CoA thioesterase
MSMAKPTVEQVGAAMMSRDVTAQWLGIALDEVRAGYARMHMRVRPEMANGHGLCHGGLIFSLADTAFAYACNSHNQVALASSCMIDFLSPGQVGDVLSAEAVEQVLRGRHGVYDVRIANQQGEIIAMFRGKSAQIKGSVVPTVEAAPLAD